VTDEEFEEMSALRAAISDNPAAVHPDKQERFTELLVQSWPATGDGKPYTEGRFAPFADPGK
jgi:hypothetical protein